VELAKELSTLRLPPPPAWLNGLPVVGEKLTDRWLALAALGPQELTARLAPYLRTALAWFAAQAGSFGSLVLNFLLTVAIAAILYAKGEAAAGQLRRFFRRLAGARGDAIVVLSGSAIRAVALGIVVTAVVQSAIAGIGLSPSVSPSPPSSAPSSSCSASPSSARSSAWSVRHLAVRDRIAGARDGPCGGDDLRPGHRQRPAAVAHQKGADLSLLLIIPGVIGGLLWLGIIGLSSGRDPGGHLYPARELDLFGSGQRGARAHRGGHCHSAPDGPGRGRLGHAVQLTLAAAVRASC